MKKKNLQVISIDITIQILKNINIEELVIFVAFIKAYIIGLQTSWPH